MDSLEFEVNAIKRSYTEDKFWPTFPSATLQVAAPATQGTKGEDDMEVDNIPVPLLTWMEQRQYKLDPDAAGKNYQSLHQRVGFSFSSFDLTRSFSRSLSLHLQVFNHFHSSNCMVGPGDVYGGDFVLYKNGGPAQTHSIATVLVHDSHVVRSHES